MPHIVSELKNGVAGLLTGTNLNNVTNLDDALERAVRTLLQKASVPEASTSNIITLYDGVTDYSAPALIFGGALRDIRPLGLNRTPNDYVYRQYIEQFDRTKCYVPSGFTVTFEFTNAQPIMRIAQNKATKRIILDPMTSITGWVASGLATTPVLDQSFYYQTPGSLRFNLTGSGIGALTKTLSNSVDLTIYQGVGVVFLALQIPATNLTSVELRLGSDKNNYYDVIATASSMGAFVAGDFLLIPFDLSKATQTGTPVITKMQYVDLIFTTTAAMTNLRAGQLFISMPYPVKIFYESTGIFQNAGILSNNITTGNDVIILNDAAYNLYEHECAITIGLQNGGQLAEGLLGNLSAVLNGARAKNGTVITLGLYDLYRADNPSEELRTIGNYYNDE